MDGSAQDIGAAGMGTGETESTYAWLRLVACLAFGTVGSAGMWAVVVTLPAVQAEFGVARADASLPYTLTMIGFGIGTVTFGRLVDRLGIVPPAIGAAMMLGLAFIASSYAPSLTTFALANLAIGAGSSVTFAPLIADISHWFTRRRGIAVAICAAGNYLGGAAWPPIVQRLTEAHGWRTAQIAVGVACIVLMLPLVTALRRKLGRHDVEAAAAVAGNAQSSLGLSPAALFALLGVAGVGCCVAMAMPQVHIVAYCGDLGYGVPRGAEMLSLMLGFGIISRVASGFIADRIGGVATLLIGSLLQGVALLLYLLFDGLFSLYVISALFGLFQGGIVPMYAVIVRTYFPPRLAGTLVGLVIMATIVGMALGGWLSGLIFDLTGSYAQAFLHGLAWNLVNGMIAAFLLLRQTRLRPAAA